MDVVKSKSDIKRVKTYIFGLDENLQGGVPEGHAVLVNGRSGTMKSSISFNILYNEALAGTNSLYLTLEQSAPSLLNHMVNMDFDLSKVNLVIAEDISKISQALKQSKSSKKGTIILADLGPIRKKVRDTKFSAGTDWLSAIKNVIDTASSAAKCRLFVLDSLSALYALSRFEDPRQKLFYTFDFLRSRGLTSFLVSESPFDKNRLTEYGVEEYLADGILHLEMTERYRKVTREISVPKMRATDCNLDIFTLEYRNRKFNALYGGKTPVV